MKRKKRDLYSAGKQLFASGELTESEIETRFVVYSIYDPQGVLLYIGKTGNISRRLREHKRTYGPLMDVVKKRYFSTPIKMDLAEIISIAELKPILNKRRNKRA